MVSGVRRIIYFFLGTVTVVVLLFGYHTSTSSKMTADSSAVAAPAANPPAGASGGSTLTGTAAQTRWGPVQVQLTMSGSTITNVTVLQSPSGNGRDVEINDNALPILIKETLAAQSASIDMVSGATVTSDGYLTSLQSALDQK